jgi:acyl-CoA hydrolase
VKKGTVKHTNSSFFTMVAKGDDDKPAVVPRLILETREDVKRFIESMNAKKVRAMAKAQMDDAKSHIEVENAKELLKKERCVIAWNFDR